MDEIWNNGFLKVLYNKNTKLYEAHVIVFMTDNFVKIGEDKKLIWIECYLTALQLGINSFSIFLQKKQKE